MAPAILVGTRKGLFVLKGDETRRTWELEGPHLSGWDVFHAMKHDGSLYAAANHGVYGATVQRSDDGGKTWERSEGLGLPEEHELTLEKTWHVEPGHERRRSGSAARRASSSAPADRGESWEPVMSLIDHPTRERWNPGAGGMCTHSIQFDPDERPDDVRRASPLPACSAATTVARRGRRRTRARPRTSTRTTASPSSASASTRCSLHPEQDGPPLAAEPLRRLSHGRQRRELGAARGQRPSELFGFPIAIHHLNPDMAFVIPEDSVRGSEGEVGGGDRVTTGGRLGVYRTEDGGRSWELASNGLPEPAWVEVLREGMASDRRDPSGSTSARRAARSSSRPTRATSGWRRRATCRRCFRSKPQSGNRSSPWPARGSGGRSEGVRRRGGRRSAARSRPCRCGTCSSTSAASCARS